jgi:large subunit ribosomal protein L10
MNRDQKAAVVEEVATQIQESEAVFAVDYRGISVPQAADLRVKLNEAGARFRVVKNTLTELAAERAGADPLKEVLDGPTAFTFVAADGGDVALAAKALAQFRRETELLEFKGGVMNGEAVTAEQIGAIARLPAKEVLHGQLVGVIASPITGLVRGLNALIAGLAIQLQQIAEQGLVGGDAPAAEAEESPSSDEAEESSSSDSSSSSSDEGEGSDEDAAGSDEGGDGDEAGDGDEVASAEAASEPDEAAGDASESAGDASESAGDDPAEADQAAQADQAEEEAAQAAEGEETESSSEESAPAGEEAAGEESGDDENETPSEGDEKE